MSGQVTRDRAYQNERVCLIHQVVEQPSDAVCDPSPSKDTINTDQKSWKMNPHQPMKESNWSFPADR